MLKIEAVRPGSARATSTRQKSNEPSRNGPIWKTVLKVAVIIVAIAIAIYVGKTYVIPAIAKAVTAAKAAAAAVGDAVVTTATTAAKVSSTTSKIVWTAMGQGIGVGGGTSTGTVAGNFLATTVLKPVEAIKIVFQAVGDLIETETVSVPFAAAGGGGFAW